MSIKLKQLYLANRKYFDLARLWMTAERKKLTYPLWKPMGTRKCLTLLPPLFRVKGTWILTQARWFFGTQVHHLLSLLAFQIKSLFLVKQLNSQFISLLCCEQNELGFHNNTTPRYASSKTYSCVYWKHVQVFSCSVQFSCSVVSDSLRPHGLHHTRLPCPSPAPGVYANSCPLSWWWHPAISSSVVPFFFRLQSFPASESFKMNQFIASGGQSIGVSASAPVLPMNIQDWFPLGWTGWISLLSKGLSGVFSNTTVQKHQYFSIQLSL